MNDFNTWLELPENDHMKSDYNKADRVTQVNFRLFWIGGRLAVMEEQIPLSQREAKGIEVDNG